MARDIALAAALDQPWLAVHRRPVVAILAGGDELALPGTPLPAAGLPNSNGPGLAAAVRALGAEPRLLPAPSDSVAATAKIVDEHARGADLLVSAGGASVGGHDLVRPALESLGYDEAFWQVAVRPGKPVFFGQVAVGAGLPVLGLPGNPVSALVCAGLFAGPALARLAGLPEAACTPPAARKARLVAPLPAEGKRRAFLRAQWAEGDTTDDNLSLPWVQPLGGQDSSMIAELARAELLIEREPEAPAAEAGAAVTVRPLSVATLGL